MTTPRDTYPLEIQSQMHFDLYIYFSFSFALIGSSFAFTDGTYAGIDAESRTKNASQAEPHIWIAFHFLLCVSFI